MRSFQLNRFGIALLVLLVAALSLGGCAPMMQLPDQAYAPQGLGYGAPIQPLIDFHAHSFINKGCGAAVNLPPAQCLWSPNPYEVSADSSQVVAEGVDYNEVVRQQRAQAYALPSMQQAPVQQQFQPGYCATIALRQGSYFGASTFGPMCPYGPSSYQGFYYRGR